ncbi:chaperone protein TorD [Slackia heliotrinireducens]|uniref:Uncharacterized protein n=1 Tax=Slackia heliotrinireducens (strain ATCC 29202 / DSM 20476 / NCTC 11029 / RHS 1) TaxID=471855 RepID=C7N420_SLAHD|nr:molecular chaperone TorD family protein [Slackia heliotrinireducens]ACV23756.1 hypothetical protein Shel_27590 [Slackia heliotrinireducens DSM 20476]VEH03379.1 chaperone protein TorD [Slackia heliotrinireducens]
MQEEIRSIGSLIVSRAWLYELFRKAIGGQPTEDIVSFLTCATTADVLSEYAADDTEDCAVVRNLAEMCSRQDAVTLEVCASDYNSVVNALGSRSVPLWESSWIAPDGALFSARTLAVRQAFRSKDLQAKRFNRVPEDSLAMMLEFGAKLAKDDYRSFVNGDAAKLASCLSDEAAFINEHLLNWLPQAVAKAQEKNGAENLYVVMLKTIEAFLRLDAAFAANAVAWLQGQPSYGAVEDGPELRAFDAIMVELKELETIQPPFIVDSEIVSI